MKKINKNYLKILAIIAGVGLLITFTVVASWLAGLFKADTIKLQTWGAGAFILAVGGVLILVAVGFWFMPLIGWPLLLVGLALLWYGINKLRKSEQAIKIE